MAGGTRGPGPSGPPSSHRNTLTPRVRKSAPRARLSPHADTSLTGAEPVMAGIHQTLKEARSLYAEAVKLQEAVLASHRDLEGCVAQVQTWHESMEALAARVEALTVRLKNLGRGFLALVFMIGTLAGLAGGFLALMLFRLAGG